MSFGFDDESRLYLPYVVGSESRKERLSRRADAARFLVYATETMFNWRSVLLAGEISRVPDDEREAIEDTMWIAWRPELFERATTVENTRLYQFRIDEQVGIQHLGLPPELRTKEPGSNPA